MEVKSITLKIEKKLSKSGKEYVGLWFENWLVTIDRRAIYKLVAKEDVKNLSVGESINIPLTGDFYFWRESSQEVK